MHISATPGSSGNLFPAQYGLAELKSFYREYSEWGKHPGLGAIAMHSKLEVNLSGLDWQHTCLETDPKRTVALLFQVLLASAMIEVPTSIASKTD